MHEVTTETINLTIDGIAVTVPKGTLVIEAARRVGVMIPHFCYHPKLTPDANCRMCLVEIEKMPRLQTSCSTPVSEGMVVRTATSVVNESHKSVLEFILANHPLDCPVCDQGGRCDLQDYSHEYTPTTSRFIEIKRIFKKEYFSPLIETQMNRCVQCLRCVRYCDQVMDVNALAPSGRGTMTEIKHFGDHELDCEFCGGCVQICPVGAITSRLSMYEFRPWMLKRADTICTYCGDGCQITIQAKDNELIEVNSAHGAGRNTGDLCARGFFGYQMSTHPHRLTSPMIRRHGELVAVPWEEALEYLAEACVKLKLAHGAQAFAGLASSRCTNEDLYLFQKFMRLAIGSNKIDSSARYGHINAVRALRRVQGTHRWAATFEDIVRAGALLLVGTNITETNPITGLKVKEAIKKHGATLVTVESLEPAVGKLNNIANLSTHHFSAFPGTYPDVVLGLIKAVIEGGHLNAGLAARAPAYVQALRDRVGALTWSAIESSTGASESALKEAAQAFAQAPTAVIILGQGVLRTPGAEGVTTNLLDLLILTGHHGRSGCGIAPLAEENNDQGAIEMGVAAEFLPGPYDITDAAARERLAGVWKDEVPPSSGLTLMDMVDEARLGKLKGMFVMGENPVASLPASTGVTEALQRLDLLVCQELFLTETAKLAHVVLPASSYAEKDGTFTNSEGHVQQVRRAIDPVGDSRPDWEILSALSSLMGYPLEYGDAREIFKEIRSTIPGYRLMGPAPQPPRPDGQVVDRYLQEGYAKDLATRYRLSSSPSVGSDHLTLRLVQTLFHSGKLSTYAKGLLAVQDKGCLAMNPADADQREIAAGQMVIVRNGQGEFRTQATILERVPRGLVCFPEHFAAEVRPLLSAVVDPVTRSPYFLSTEVQVAKLD